MVAQNDPVFAQQFVYYFCADFPEVACVNAGVVLRLCRRIVKKIQQSLRRSGGHRRAHVRHVGHTEIDNAPHGRVPHLNVAAHTEHRAARSCRRPLRSRRALAAVFQRHAELPLRRAEVGGGHRAGVVRRAAFHHDGGHDERLRHRGARPVLPKERNVHSAQTKRARNALVQQIPRKYHVNVLLLKPRLAYRKVRGFRLQHAFRFFPAFLIQIRIEKRLVKVARQRARGFLFSAHRRVAQNRRAALK